MWVSLGLLPVFQVFIATLTFILCYVWSVTREDVSPAFPFISDTGANSPESCLFAQMLNISAFLSAILAFGLGVVYSIVQTVMSYRLQGKLVCRFRLAITVFNVCAGISMAASWITASKLWHSRPNSGNAVWWKPDDPGYAAHICSTVFEWALSLGFFSFFLTYVSEFDSIETEIIFRPLANQRARTRSRSTARAPNSASVENGGPTDRSHPRSRPLHSVNSLCRQENIRAGETSSLLGTATDSSNSFHGSIST
ncbi:DNA damage-regulated autophagy modulator protein 2 [Elysia marginata]|uniref:DNA damage-regulated autophagy modulator protein 2 n=1 Tax=Elysia marginata TaxID=1093978 RepID=A0AAV4HVX9_9GAST|nr:DNA damage-regulated autophagy modulator protein 2 [Elysia marginata]